MDFQLSSDSFGCIIPVNRFVNIFTKRRFLRKKSTAVTMRYTPPTINAAPLRLPMASPRTTMNPNAKTARTITRRSDITSMANTLLKPADKPAMTFLLKSSVLMLRYSLIAEDSTFRMLTFPSIIYLLRRPPEFQAPRLFYLLPFRQHRKHLV